MEDGIVGKSHEVLKWYPTTLVSCQCQHPQQVILIVVEFKNPVMCPFCRKAYVLTRLTALGPEVDVILPTELQKVM